MKVTIFWFAIIALNALQNLLDCDVFCFRHIFQFSGSFDRVEGLNQSQWPLILL